MAEAMGVNTAWMRVVIFVYAAVLAAISGFLYAHLQRAVNPTPFGLNHGIEFLFMAVVGGVSHVWGAVLGATILTVLQDYLQTLLPKLLGANGNFEIIVFGVLMVLAAAVRATRRVAVRRRGSFRVGRAPTFRIMPRRCRSAASPSAGERLLIVDKARKEFGGLVAVNDVSFEVKAGEIIGLIGPNGAGKSTTFNLVTGVLQATSGAITFHGERIDSLTSREIVKRGIGRTFQHVKLLPGMTVLENVAIGAHLRGKTGVWRSVAQPECGRGSAADGGGGAADRARRAGEASSTTKPAASRWANSGFSKSRGRCAAIRLCCCSTNRRPDCAIRRSCNWPSCCASLRRKA